MNHKNDGIDNDNIVLEQYMTPYAWYRFDNNAMMLEIISQTEGVSFIPGREVKNETPDYNNEYESEINNRERQFDSLKNDSLGEYLKKKLFRIQTLSPSKPLSQDEFKNIGINGEDVYGDVPIGAELSRNFAWANLKNEVVRSVYKDVFETKFTDADGNPAGEYYNYPSNNTKTLMKGEEIYYPVAVKYAEAKAAELHKSQVVIKWSESNKPLYRNVAVYDYADINPYFALDDKMIAWQRNGYKKTSLMIVTPEVKNPGKPGKPGDTIGYSMRYDIGSEGTDLKGHIKKHDEWYKKVAVPGFGCDPNLNEEEFTKYLTEHSKSVQEVIDSLNKYGGDDYAVKAELVSKKDKEDKDEGNSK